MAIVRAFFLAVGLALLVGCANLFTSTLDLDQVQEVYVADFHSDDMTTCDPSDVPLSHGRARKFFQRARIVDYKTIHDHYDVAPCYIEGSLRYRSKGCGWKILAGATAEVRCGENTWHLVCDDCEDLFEDKTPKYRDPTPTSPAPSGSGSER
jgi:hypothetical protein